MKKPKIGSHTKHRKETAHSTKARPTPFPAAWTWFVDELLVSYAKEKYSPQEGWKSKPFSKEDARFFFKGIDELSQLFTEERPKGMVPYFQHPKYRCAYLLYFLPLQAAKFVTLFELHRQALEATFEAANRWDCATAPNPVMRISDIGCGPGTASIAFLLWVLQNGPASIPAIEFYWSDTNPHIMQDGKNLVETLANYFPKLRGKVKVHTQVASWWQYTAPQGGAHLTLVGHVLNEATAPGKYTETFWSGLLSELHGGGLLLLEPASRRPSQVLSRLRDSMFANGWIDSSPQRIWGPCLHAGACPLAEGRDWCHFSVPSWIPGAWFKDFSERLGSERQWVKFSYLWISSRDYLAPERLESERRVISDSLSQGVKATHLLCEPEQPLKWSPPMGQEVWRGDIIRLGSDPHAAGRPRFVVKPIE